MDKCVAMALTELLPVLTIHRVICFQSLPTPHAIIDDHTRYAFMNTSSCFAFFKVCMKFRLCLVPWEVIMLQITCISQSDVKEKSR